LLQESARRHCERLARRYRVGVALFKVLAAGFIIVSMLSGVLGLIVSLWLVRQTAHDPIAQNMEGMFRSRAIAAAALRGAWPDLPSAKLYRRCMGTTLATLVGAIACLVLENLRR
jgi:hypothetical protein